MRAAVTPTPGSHSHPEAVFSAPPRASPALTPASASTPLRRSRVPPALLLHLLQPAGPRRSVCPQQNGSPSARSLPRAQLPLPPLDTPGPSLGVQGRSSPGTWPEHRCDRKHDAGQASAAPHTGGSPALSPLHHSPCSASPAGLGQQGLEWVLPAVITRYWPLWSGPFLHPIPQPKVAFPWPPRLPTLP